MDISHLSVGELKELKHQIDARIQEREAHEFAQGVEQARAIAAKLGVSLEALLGGTAVRKKGKTGTKAAVQFRNPGDKSQQWSGRGRQPKWVKELLASGQSLDDFRA